jgi:desulfoferrodoxin-like iron-binding protein
VTRMANKAGKRMKCESCGAEVVVTKSGDGEVLCCSQPMAAK